MKLLLHLQDSVIICLDGRCSKMSNIYNALVKFSLYSYRKKGAYSQTDYAIPKLEVAFVSDSQTSFGAVPVPFYERVNDHAVIVKYV